jgi:hypothetical protein
MEPGFEAGDDLSPLQCSNGTKLFLIRLPKDVSNHLWKTMYSFSFEFENSGIQSVLPLFLSAFFTYEYRLMSIFLMEELSI